MRAVIVAHGQPSEPGPQEEVMEALAAQVAALLPDMEVRGCTLASAGALEATLGGAVAPLIYPFFMAEGWFTRSELPRRLRAAGADDARQLTPFGADPGLAPLMTRITAGADRILLAGHGSQRSRTSADTLETAARQMRALRPEATILTGYVEQAPALEESARRLVRGLCLPFFALEAGHVRDDIPEALEAAGFDGPALPPLGQDPGIPALIAQTLRAARQSASPENADA